MAGAQQLALAAAGTHHAPSRLRLSALLIRRPTQVVTIMNLSDSILYERYLSSGPAVRIRRTSDEGERPVVAVLELERRTTSARRGRGGLPPALLVIEGESEADVMASLEPQARDDGTVTRLMRERGMLIDVVQEIETRG